MLSDALPDGWGMLLMDRLFRKEQRTDVSPLDRLAFIGDRAMGALAFEPADGEKMTEQDVRLLDLAQEVQLIMDDESEPLLRKLALMGGSPHGARPKVLVNFDQETNRMSNAQSGSGVPMLVKFPAQNERKEVCAVEALYSRLAKASGIRVPASQYFDLSADLAAFGIERFDRVDAMKVPMHTAAGAAHADFRHPQLDYVELLRLTKLMTRDIREVQQAFEHCVFNVVFNNRDDHAKNFSFLLTKTGEWKFSPAYDLTFSEGPGGEHQMDICGEAKFPAREHLLELAIKTGLSKQDAIEAIDRISEVPTALANFVGDLPISKKTLSAIEKAVTANRLRLSAK